MSRLRCTLCDCEIENGEFNLQKSTTLYSKSSLLLLLQTCLPQEQICMTSYEICKICYFLLNELDSVRLRAKTIEDQIKSYVHKRFTNKLFKYEAEETAVDKTEQCTVCLRKFNSNDFKSHLKTHHPELNDLETSFDFDEVGSISDLNPSLEDINILNSIEAEKDNGKVVKSEVQAEKAVKKAIKKEGNNLKPFECDQCSKTWRTAGELKNHMSSHSEERPYICEICGQAYKRQQALAIHVGMHNGVNPFTCVYCNKSFTQKGALIRHTPIHTGELPFQCDLCGKRFVHHTSFNMHRLSHTGQKSFKCEVCGLLLISGSHLKRHMRVHTGEKKYSCNTCGKKFAEKYNLAVHEKLHLGITKKRKHKCKFCENVYPRLSKLEEHLLAEHQKIEDSIE